MSRLKFKRSAIKLRSFLTPEEIRAQDILTFGKKIQITKLPRISADNKQDIRKKIKELEQELARGKIEPKNIVKFEKRIKHLKSILTKGVIPLFELKFDDLRERIEEGNLQSLKNIKKIADNLAILFARANSTQLDLLNADELLLVFQGLKLIGFSKNWRDHKEIVDATEFRDPPSLASTEVQTLFPTLAKLALLNHLDKSELQGAPAKVSLVNPILVYSAKNEIFLTAPLSRLISIGIDQEYDLDHRAILPTDFLINREGTVVDAFPEDVEDVEEL